MTFAYRVDRWTDDGNSILDYVAAVSPLRGQPIGQHAGDGRRLRSRSGKARGWWREIGQRARPPT